ncbi:MAG: mechanosensitive ion channel family protein, partial [Hyphomicrobiales bacterium]
IATVIRRRTGIFAAPAEGTRAFALRQFIASLSNLLFPLLAVTALAATAEVARPVLGSNWVVIAAQSAAVVYLLYALIKRFVSHPIVRTAAIWVGLPLAALRVFGHYDAVSTFLDGMSLEAGNIRLSVYFLIKAVIAGAILFWLGRQSSKLGQNAIRKKENLEPATRELFAKLFEIALYCVVFVVLLQVLGLDLTALTVFGGALGVGLGFGLQQIASNFISGLILLFERSMSAGDFIELEDGRSGIIKDINMRSTTLETFDGKEIMVPNEKFITSAFTNWTRDDPRQRYEVEFSVAYDTDLHKVPPLIQAAVSKHPRVLQEPEKPDCELRGFGDSGVNLGVEFWVDGLDDGPNKFSSDVLFLVWDALKGANITIPFPQREVRVIDNAAKLGIKKSS